MDGWLKALCNQYGVTETGVCRWEGGSVLVALFPYYAGETENANLSRYARSPDYHRTVRKYLTPIADAVNDRIPQAEATVLVDSHPLPERELAVRAGLGFIGKNGCLIHPVYGSYVFIGLIRTSVLLEEDAPCTDSCLGCGRCAAVCPANLLTGSFDPDRCLSALTQKRGDFTAEEETAYLRGNLIWGCDRCQEVCPHNRDLPLTPIPELKEKMITRLSASDLEGLSDRGFRRQYGEYAFSWRGLAPLKRNLAKEDAREDPERSRHR